MLKSPSLRAFNVVITLGVNLNTFPKLTLHPSHVTTPKWVLGLLYIPHT